LSLVERKHRKSSNNPQNEANGWLLRGLEYEEKGDFDYAIQCYKNAILGLGTDKEAWNNIGLAYYLKGDFQNADSALNKALELDPDYAVAWETKGYLYAIINNLDRAMGYLKKALQCGEKKADIWVTLGIIHSAELRLEDAISAYENALTIDPKNVNSLNNQGLAFQLLSQLREGRDNTEMLEKAVNCFERALAIDPNKPEIWNNYGVVLGFLGRYKSSLWAIDKAILLAPKYANAYFNRARVYLQIGERNKALAQLKAAVDMDGNLYKDALEDSTLKELRDTEEFRRMAHIEK
jgi:tetratricopeptide (TPR) repeat protein